MTSCGSCGVSGQPDGARFCFACGSALAAPSCSGCGADVVPGARFCSSCGTDQTAVTGPVVQVASRRITSVLFGDLVGFTALSENRDQEHVRELLSRYFDECRAIIGRYGGTVEKFIGDAVMAVWGVPTAHEDDAERAVRAGLELVNAVTAMGTDVGVPDLAMRVGIVTGEVAVTVGAEHQGMVAGDAVNTASRVQTAAAPGQVWVDETTRLLTSSAITYVDVGSHPLKGKAEPIPLWAVRAVVAAVGGAQRADGLEAPLVGRDREIRLIRELFHRVEESDRPALLVVDGEAGVGKSRLAWEFEKWIDGLSAAVRWHAGRCLSYGEGVAYFALAEAIRSRLQNLSDATDEDDQARLLTAGLDRLVDDADERAWLEPRLAALLGIGAVGSYPREDLFSAWTTFLSRVSELPAEGRAERTPVVLLVDDAQYADEGLLMFIEHLLAVGTFPCFVALLTRPGLLEENPGLATNRRATVVHLDALAPAEMGQLLDGLVAGLDDDVRASLVERAEGIPLFAVETVRSLIDRDLVVPRGGQYVLAGDRPLDLDRIGAPASLQALVAARLDKLPPAQRRVVDQASVVGESFTRDQIAALCPDVPDLDDALTALLRVQLLRQESNRFSAELGNYQFVQAVVRQVAYGTLSRRVRKATHLDVARLEEGADETAAIVAQHYLEAIDAVPDDADVEELTRRAVEQLQRAAARASMLGSTGEAAGHLRTALARVADPAQRRAVQLALAVALHTRGDSHAAIEHATAARDAFDEIGDELRAASAVAVLAEAITLSDDRFDEGMAMLAERHAALLGRPDAVRVLLELVSIELRLSLRRSLPLRDLVDEKAVLAELSGDAGELADSYIGLAIHYMLTGTRSLGRTLLESAAELARANHQGMILTRALLNLNVEWTLEDVQRAAEIGRQAVEASQHVGDLFYVSASHGNLAISQLLLGEWDEALVNAEFMALDVPLADMMRSEIAWARAEEWSPPADLEERLTRADLSLRTFSELTAARAAQARGDVDQAVHYARAAVITAAGAGALFDDFTIIFRFATDIIWDSGRRDVLDELLAIIDGHTGSIPPRGSRVQRTRLAARIAIADGADAETVEKNLRAALALAEQWRANPTIAMCRAELGEWLASVGRADEGAPYLEQARATLTELGATRLLEQLEPVPVQHGDPAAP